MKSKRIRKFQNFMEFTIRYKLLRLVRYMTVQELSELCYEELPHIGGNTLSTGRAIIVISTVEQELKRRMPKNLSVQNTDFTDPKSVSKLLTKLGGMTNV